MLTKAIGFTLIELIMVVVIISIIALATSGILIYFMRNTIFLPNQLNVQQVADAAMDLMIEGDLKAQGLRFARKIIAFDDNSVQFTDSGGKNVLYSIQNNAITRSIDGQPAEQIPYYAAGSISVSGQGGILFRFFDANEAATTVAANVRRVGIGLVAMSGSGSVNDWEGQISLGSSVKLYKFNQPPYFATPLPSANPSSIPLLGQSTISFAVNDPDGGAVNWTATRSGNPRGTLNPASGTGIVPYNTSTVFTSTSRKGTATITINLNDASGGIATASVTISVY